MRILLVEDNQRLSAALKDQLEKDGYAVDALLNGADGLAYAEAIAYDLIIHSGIVHDGDPELAAHVAAAVRREQERGFTLSKGKSRRHIDAAVAMCMGLFVLHQLLAEPVIEPSVFFV